MSGKQLCGEGPRDPGGHEAEREAAACACGKGSSWLPGLLQAECCEQGERCDPCALLPSDEAPVELCVQFWVLHYKRELERVELIL